MTNSAKKTLTREKLLAFLQMGDSNFGNVTGKNDYAQNSNSKQKVSTITANQNNHSLYGENYKKLKEIHKIKLK